MFGSELREPRLPKLDPPPELAPEPEWELPARASARVGANINVRQNSPDSTMCHFDDRLDMGISLYDPKNVRSAVSI